MLEFFRRYQRFFLIIITFVIVVSFSFFGTYDAFVQDKGRDPVVFKTLNGAAVTQSELDELVGFLGTDSDDKIALGGMWGPNFLNDGVIRKDFLSTGLAEVIFLKYSEDLRGDLQQRLDKERHYVPYVNARAPFLSAVNAWTYFAPEIKANYDYLKTFTDAGSPDAFSTRVRLYLAEKQFPSYALRHVLKYQQGQYNWLPADPQLEQSDLFLYGHHTLEDWFGRRFTQIVAEVILNAAIVAEQRGYVVTKSEATADLLQNADASYQQMKSDPNMMMTSSAAYMQDQLRRMGMDTSRAVTLWRKVMLFRRLFHDAGNAAFIDALPYQKFNEYAKESVTVDLYQLPRDLRFKDFRSLQKFETYLAAVARNPDSAPLSLPIDFLTVAEVSRNFPELVQKRYLLEVASVNKAALQSKVSLKQTWDWEVQDSNWKMLTQQFPELGAAKAQTRDERFAALDKMDDKARTKVDSLARSAIVEAHPEWVQEALAAVKPVKSIAAIRLKGGTVPFQGADDRQALINLLDRAPLSSPGDGSPVSYSGDGAFYYQVWVVERAPEMEVLTFAEANGDGTLDAIVDRQLEAYYTKVRGSHEKTFRSNDGGWKPYADVKKEVAELYFSKVLKAIYDDYVAVRGTEKVPQAPTGEFAASHRFFKYMREAEERVERDPNSNLVRDGNVETAEKTVAGRLDLRDQWRLVRNEFTNDRTNASEEWGIADAFQLQVGAWSPVHTPANGNINFYVLKRKGAADATREIAAKVDQAYGLLGSEVQRLLMLDILSKMQK